MSEQCGGIIEGPAINRNGNPSWRRRCKRRVDTKDGALSALCHDHKKSYITGAGRIVKAARS